MNRRIQMSIILFLVVIVFAYACGDRVTESDTLNSGTDSVLITAETGTESDFSESDVDTFFVVIVDTGAEYFTLRDKMLEISKKHKLPVDTMGRHFNVTKNLIALPDDDEDEIYAGEYYPRRFPSENLSLEYLSFCSKNAGDKTIAMVSGIYETAPASDSAVKNLRTIGIAAFKIESVIYTGCMH